MSDCRTVQASLDVLVTRAKSAWPRAVAAHVAACERCAHSLAVERLARGLVAVAARGSAPPVGFAGRVIAAGPHARTVGADDFWRPAWIALPAFGAITAALLVLALLAGTRPPALRAAPGLLAPTSAAEQLVSGTGADSIDAALAAILMNRS